MPSSHPPHPPLPLSSFSSLPLCSFSSLKWDPGSSGHCLSFIFIWSWCSSTDPLGLQEREQDGVILITTDTQICTPTLYVHKLTHTCTFRKIEEYNTSCTHANTHIGRKPLANTFKHIQTHTHTGRCIRICPQTDALSQPFQFISRTYSHISCTCKLPCSVPSLLFHICTLCLENSTPVSPRWLCDCVKVTIAGCESGVISLCPLSPVWLRISICGRACGARGTICRCPPARPHFLYVCVHALY